MSVWYSSAQCLIESISLASPAVVTSTGHGLSTGDVIQIIDTDSTPILDGERTVTRINDDTFSVGVNTTGAGTADTGSWRQGGTKIKDAEFLQDRLFFVGGEYVAASQTGDLYNFYAEDATVASDADPIGKRVGGFKRRAEEIIEGELAVVPELLPIFEALMQARRDILARIAALDSRIRAVARRHATVRLLMTAPRVGPITAMAVLAAFDDASRFHRSSSAGAYLGLTPRRYESGEISRNGRVSKRGDGFTRKCLFEAANAIFCRNLGGPRLRDWARAIAERTGPRKAKVALARKLAVTLHAMWRTNTPFQEAAMA